MSHLSQHFVGVASKRLSAVEADPGTSNQHEFNGVARLKALLGIERREIPVTMLYLADEDADRLTSASRLTWYDSREANPSRTEHRLYFPSDEVTAAMRAGDLLVFALRPDDTALLVVARSGSTAESQLSWLFGLDAGDDLVVAAIGQGADRTVSFAERAVLEALGVESHEEPDDLDLLLKSFGPRFPDTRAFSEFAHGLTDVEGLDPDDVLMAWLEREESLFRTLERHLVADRLRDGFGEDVEAFISYSLSIQNRRKSRAGYALENHLERLFLNHGVRYIRNPTTEGRSRPDFIFPGIEQYNDPEFATDKLAMLGVKATCKERWRQILAEAARIPCKHLLTVEPAISTAQTDEMAANQVQLVVPAAVRASYTADQRHRIWTVQEFVNFVKPLSAATDATDRP